MRLWLEISPLEWTIWPLRGKSEWIKWVAIGPFRLNWFFKL